MYPGNNAIGFTQGIFVSIPDAVKDRADTTNEEQQPGRKESDIGCVAETDLTSCTTSTHNIHDLAMDQ